VSFITQQQDDLRLAMLNTEEFAETVVYTKAAGYDYLVDKASQENKSIKAFVVREQLGPTLQNNSRNLNREMEIYILNNATYGVTVVRKGQDKVAIPVQIGESAVEFNVADILDQDDVAFHLLLTR